MQGDQLPSVLLFGLIFTLRALMSFFLPPCLSYLSPAARYTRVTPPSSSSTLSPFINILLSSFSFPSAMDLTGFGRPAGRSCRAHWAWPLLPALFLGGFFSTAQPFHGPRDFELAVRRRFLAGGMAGALFWGLLSGVLRIQDDIITKPCLFSVRMQLSDPPHNVSPFHPFTRSLTLVPLDESLGRALD